MMHSLASPALRQAGYSNPEANQLIRLARHGGLQQAAGGAYHDPTNAGQSYADPTPTPLPGQHDPLPFDRRAAVGTDPNYYGGFKTPDVQQGLEAVAQRWAHGRPGRRGQ